MWKVGQKIFIFAVILIQLVPMINATSGGKKPGGKKQTANSSGGNKPTVKKDIPSTQTTQVKAQQGAAPDVSQSLENLRCDMIKHQMELLKARLLLYPIEIYFEDEQKLREYVVKVLDYIYSSQNDTGLINRMVKESLTNVPPGCSVGQIADLFSTFASTIFPLYVGETAVTAKQYEDGSKQYLTTYFTGIANFLSA